MATAETAVMTEEQRNLSALDVVRGEAEQGSKERIIIRRAELDYRQRLARVFAMSGCFADIKGQSEQESVARALVKIMLGESMGFSEPEAMTGIDIIQGRVAVGASLRAARMQRAGFSWPQMICTNIGCWMPLEYKGVPLMQQKVNEKGEVVLDADGKPVMVQAVVSYTAEDAKAAGLITKDNYKKNPSDMYFARCITRAQRRYGPGVLGVDILSTEEARDLPPETEPIRASISIQDVKASSDSNRGHDATAPTAIAAPVVTEPVAVEQVHAKPELKHLGERDGVAIFSDTPPPETVEHGQKVYVCKNGTETLWIFESEFENADGTHGAWMEAE